MKIKVLASATDNSVHQFAASYVIDDSVAIDAGSLGFASLECQRNVRHIVISHTHLDHIASLPIFLDNVYQAGPDCVSLYGSEEVLQTLRECFFNDRVWPDVFRLAREEGSPFVQMVPLASGVTVTLDKLKITPVELDHNIPTFGFVIEKEGVAVAIVSDTGPTQKIWDVCNRSDHLKAVFLESAFPNSRTTLANKARHLTPNLLFAEQSKLNQDVSLIVVHIKPAFYDEVVAELQLLNLPSMTISVPNKEYEF